MPSPDPSRKLNGETMKKSAFLKDVGRTLRNNLSRFIALVVMTALGSGVFTGFAAGCLDVFDSADRFYDKQNTYDIKIASTLGLTDQDLTALSGLDRVDAAFGNCSMDVMINKKDGSQLLGNITTLDPDGMNSPYVLEGTLPEKTGEIAVNSRFIRDTGYKIGDTVALSETTDADDTADKAADGNNQTSISADKTDTAAGDADTTDAASAEAAGKADEVSAEGTDKIDAASVEDTDETDAAPTEDTDVADTASAGDDETIDTTSADDIGEIAASSSEPSLAVTEYKITAIILSPLDITNTEGVVTTMSFSSSSTDYMLYTVRDCIKSDIYTTIYLTLDGSKPMDCYSEEYRALVENMTATIGNTIKKDRQQARYNEVVEDANAKVADAERELEDKTFETEQKLADAQKKINDGWSDYKDGLDEVQDNETKLTDGQQALNDAIRTADEKFAAAQKEIDDNLAKLNSGEEKLKTQKAMALEKFSSYEQELKSSQDNLDIQKSETDSQLDATVSMLSEEEAKIWNGEAAQTIWKDMIEDGVEAAPYLLAVGQSGTPTKEQTDHYNAAMAKLQSDTQALAVCFATGGVAVTEEQLGALSKLAVAYGTLDYSRAKLEESRTELAAQKSEALKKISDAGEQIANGKEKLAKGQKELDKNKREAEQTFAGKKAELKDGLQQLTDAKKKLSEAKTELTDGQTELNKNRDKFTDSVASARQKISEAKEDIAGIKTAKWYVWDRNVNDSFTGLNNDVSFIQAITRIFPIIFFLVAILISLTTMTRMVEEDRSLIGTYKSLGYSRRLISLKYILYALMACVAGGILGMVIGFDLLPKVIRMIMESMYELPVFGLSFYPAYGVGGFGLFLVGIVGATAISCVEMLHRRPSELLRPKAPKEGSRILLERIPFLWKRLNFLNKVTCRNLFRYKKRAIMTISGILGCTMLIVLGFGIRDTVGGLMSDQYDHVTVYDAIVVTDNLSTDEMNQLDGELKASGKVSEELFLQISTLTLWSGSNNMDITVMVVPDNEDFDDYVHLTNIATNKRMTLPADGIAVTKNAAKQFKLKSGDIVSLQNEDNSEYDFPITFVTANNAGNYVYISESCYQKAFGDYAGTCFLMNMTDAAEDQEWLSNLGEDKRILTVSSSQDARDQFGDVQNIIDTVVFMLIGMSAVLALTVLFTLSNINISERERELATMKVLGFKHKEVYSYVNKETFILTLLGILLGMPAGYGITWVILSNVNIADIAFHVYVSFAAYLIAALLTMIFTLLVNKITNKSIRSINMVEALKSVE